MIEIENLFDIKKYINDVKVVVFDLDDTLYNEIDYVKSGYKKISLAFPNIDKMYDRLLDAFYRKQNAIDYVLNQENMLDEKTKCLEIYRNQIPDIKLEKTIFELLNELKNSKSLGLITDGRPNGQRAKIKALGIDELFDKIIITDELGGIEYRKPNKKAFEMMKDFFECEYKDMVYIGDNLKKDFIAPNELGMKQIHYKNSKGLYKI